MAFVNTMFISTETLTSLIPSGCQHSEACNSTQFDAIMLITQMFGVSHPVKSARQPVLKVAGLQGQVKVRHAHNLKQSKCTHRRVRQEGNQATSLNVVGYVHHQKTGKTPSDKLECML